MASMTEVQQVRERVLQMARQIEELSQSNIPPQAFFPQFLQLLTSALGARAGAVWMRTDSNQLKLHCDVRLAETGLMDNPRAGHQNSRLLSEVLSTGEAVCRAPSDDGDLQAPTEHLTIVAALQAESDPIGVVQVFQRSDAPPEARPGYLQFVEQMCGYASRYLVRQKRAASAAPAAAGFWQDFEQYVLQLQHSLDMKEVAATAVNDGRLVLKSDRISLAVKRGKKVSIKAISGQDAVNPRANLVRAMVKLCQKVIATGEPVNYTGRVDNLAPQIEKPLADYIQESGSRMVVLVPLFEPEPLIKPDEDLADPRRRERRKRAIGCLVIEQVKESQPQPEFLERTELVADHVAAALNNAREHQRILFLRTLKFFGRRLEWFHGRKLAKTLAVLTVVAAIVGSLVFVPWDYRVTGEGRLMPVVQQGVFARMDGEVQEIWVPDEAGTLVKIYDRDASPHPDDKAAAVSALELSLSGRPVKKGQKLLVLRNDDLRRQLLDARNTLAEKRQEFRNRRVQKDAAFAAGDPNEEKRLSGEMQKIEVEIQSAERQIKILEEREKELIVTAPIDGVVATFQVEKLLKHRPVQRGEMLLEIMDPNGPWHLELEIEEHRMGHILRAQKKIERDDLEVEYVLGTASEETYDGNLERLATRSATSSEGTNIVEVYVATDAEQLPRRRIGSDVRAKINCGERSLGYCLFGDVIEFLRKHLWL